ncbi:acetyl-CoA synthetase-like protein [Zopfia rhizophila CBS 207.26]|uniref:Acetyl-CoA synthetase-like protein n=1 Tax=Zopfia rhizophila CBS 207.26 TaxID=1314779 RepID=A0A6A6DCS1_9PEZI|nr:acetyl-CoA synthetase-like protein [Zopfia rhizophila CBS 207.26]
MFSRHGRKTLADIYRDSIENVSAKIKTTYSSLVELLIPDEDTPAMLDPLDTKKVISHRDVYQFVHNFNLGLPSLAPGKPRVVVALPCGPTMGLACLAVATYYTMAPMTPNCGAGQFRSDVEQVQATAVLVSEPDAEKLKLKNAPWILEGHISVFIVENREDMTFDVSLMMHHEGHQADPPHTCLVPPEPNSADDIAIVLFTSGTSGTKKLVPITTHTLIAGVAFVVKSWSLTQDDRCLNMMPLHHIGGIVRNLFAPIMVGGSTICCSSFDPNLFWDLVECNHGPTWYYASPSMHATIVSEAENRLGAVSKSRIRLVCNAAGGLLPTLATQLRDTFPNCTVLPSYGMTECMPIATPPLTYCLDRPGTSGISVGPEVSIQDSNNVIAAPGATGNICVRGLPVFPGYLKDGEIDKSAFTKDGWFDTGDMGYLDQNGYLYITGRNKEVINRGGEILSPFEIEEAILSASRDPNSVIHGRVSETLAFSVPHDVLQEVVGAIIVTPAAKPRLGLKQLYEAVRNSLHQSKWPVVVVYMTGLPKARNKVLRIKLSERLDMTPMADDMNAASRYYEAVCPPPEEDVTTMIPKTRCEIGFGVVASKIKAMFDDNTEVFVRRNDSDGLPQAILFGNHGLVGDDPAKKREGSQALESRLQEQLHGYLVPSSIKFMDEFIPLCGDGSVDEAAIGNLLKSQNNYNSEISVQRDIINIFASVLACSPNDVDLETDFFAAGGDSLGVGRLLSMLRRHFQVRLASETLFANSSVHDVANIVECALREQQKASENKIPTEKDEGSIPVCIQAYSSTRLCVLLLHLLPIMVLYPLRLALWWTLFLYGIGETFTRFPLARFLGGRLLHLLLVMMGCKIAVAIIAPIVGIMVKWIVIQRHKAGIYPMWASYHNRWWITQKALQVCGKGIFNYSAWSRAMYYRLLGAKIGRNVVIQEKAQLGEYDLISIGDNAILDRHCICRPFAAERNTSMLLSHISIGPNCTIGLSSIIAPGTVLPADTCIGPNSSSWEIIDASESNRDSLTANMAQPHWILRLLVVEPMAMIAWLVGRAPWLAGLIGLVRSYPEAVQVDKEESAAMWYTNTKRIGFHYLARVGGDALGPFVLFLFILLVKRIMDSCWICGPVKTGLPMKNRNQMQKLRVALLQRLVPEGDLSKVAALLGSHYEIVSILVRALGGRVGKRVYWPGVGPSMQDFELLDIGNDVVFGSRAHLVTSDSFGSATITLSDGSMVADRVVVQPGTMVGKRTVLGSGALTRRNGYYPSDSVWIGSKAGDCICLTPAGSAYPSEPSSRGPNSLALTIERHKDANNESLNDFPTTSTPFGRAFYQRKASYRVLGLPTIICYSLLITISVTLYWNTSTILGIKFVAMVLQARLPGFRSGPWFRPLSIYALLTASIAVISTLQAILALALVVGTKWLLMGRRSPGSYDWDKSSYCQRWQIFLTTERLRQNCYGSAGILGLLTGTHYMVLFFRALGGNIGRDCALFANGKPSLFFTEPDLLTLGDRVVVDNASLVSHINSRGQFKLNELHVGDRSVLRTGSRLLSGASIAEDACLLEHTLVIAGDYINAGETYQGWPGSLFEKKRF